MRIIHWILTIALLFGMASRAQAAPVVNLDHYYIAKNSTQTALLSVTDSGTSAAEDIEGMTFRLQIAAGIGATPSIGSVDFLSGAIWSGHVSAGSIFSGAADPQYKSYTIITDNAGDYVNANGLLTKATFNAAGAAPGNYAVKLTGTKNSEPNSNFISGLGTLVPATFADGTLTVVIGGDFNRDGQLSSTDLQTMLVALTDFSAYETTYNVPAAELTAIGDLDGDGNVTNKDIQPLLDLLAAGSGSLEGVPEPATFVLVAQTFLFLVIWGRRTKS